MCSPIDVAELKLQRNDRSVKARPEINEEMLQRVSHGLVDNVARRLSRSVTASRARGDTPVVDDVPDASNEKRAHVIERERRVRQLTGAWNRGCCRLECKRKAS